MECFDLKSVLCLTTNCNMNCEYCIDNNIPDNREMSIEVFYDVMSYFGSFFHKSKTPLLITGGEPLSCSNIHLMLEYLNHHNFYYTIFTNGLLLDGNILEHLCKEQCKGVRYSCHFLNKARSEEEFRNGLRFLTNKIIFLKSKNIQISLNLILTYYIAKGLPQIINLVNKFSLGLKLQPFVNSKGSIDLKGIDLNKVLYDYSKIWFSKSVISYLPYTDYNRMTTFLNRYIEIEDISPNKNNCSNVPIVFINPNGTFSPCVYRRDICYNMKINQYFDFQNYIISTKEDLNNDCYTTKCIVV